MKTLKSLLLTVLISSVFTISTAQTNLKDNINSEVKVGFNTSSSSKTPFLNKTNQYGLVPIDANVFYANASIQKKYDSTSTFDKILKNWDYSFGLEAHVNAGKVNQFILPVAHLSARFKKFEIYVGRKREFFGLADTTGTFRSFLWSGNALPMPKIQISTPNYVSLLGKGFLSTKLGLSHGWFGNQKYTDNSYMHHKYIYFKLGRPSQTVNFTAGINHFAQWGGYSETLKDDPKLTINGHFASDGFAFLNILIPAGNLWKMPIGKYSINETANRFGNHLGTVDLGFDINTQIGRFSISRQSPWEDGQAPEVFLSGDGNYALTYSSKNTGIVQKIGFEFVNTRTQGGKISKFAELVGWSEKHPGEVQNYLNHGQYFDGWSYDGFGMGTPAIIPHSDLPKEEQIKNYRLFTRDNAVLAPALNIQGKIKNTAYSLHTAYISSKGMGRPSELTQFVSKISALMPIERLGIGAKIDVAYDNGELYGNQIGANIALIKKW